MLDLAFADNTLNLDWNGVYTGELAIRNFRIQGPFATSKSDTPFGPTVKGQIDLNGGIAYLPQGKKEVKAYVYYLYDLNLNFLKRVSILSGDPTKLDISSTIMNVEVADSSLSVSGSSIYPSIVGRVNLNGGSLSILGREFELLSEKDQATYYPYNQEKIESNYVVFKGGEKAEGVTPSPNLIALSNVTNQTITRDINNNEVVTTDKYRVITRIQGASLAFEAYKEDNTQSPPTFTQSTLSESEIRAMLLPDFLKNALGLSNNSAANSQAAGLIVDDYVNNYIRSRLIKNVEREVEKNLGLESFSLSYNFGQQLRKNVSGSSATVDPMEEPNILGIGVVKGFFDRLYIGLKYTQNMDQTIDNTVPRYFNYEITYKLTKILSLIYYREPNDFSIQNLNSGYYKVSLRAGYQF